MSDREIPTETTRNDSTSAAASESETDRVPSQLSPEEIKRLEDFEDLESLIEEPPGGSLSIISDQDVPGTPG